MLDMAFRVAAQAFRNNCQLQQFVLTDVIPTGRVLGTGSYGSVEEVSLATSVCSSLETTHSHRHFATRVKIFDRLHLCYVR